MSYIITVATSRGDTVPINVDHVTHARETGTGSVIFLSSGETLDTNENIEQITLKLAQANRGI